MQKGVNPKIAIDRATYEVIRQIAFEQRISMGKVIAERFDPRTPEEREQDRFAAEVYATQEADRP